MSGNSTGRTRKPNWRQRWALAEDERRRAAHDAAVDEWQNELDRIEEFVEVAESFQPEHASPALGDFRLRRDETVYWTGDVDMIEVADTPGLATSAYHRLFVPAEMARHPRPVPPGPTADRGKAVITDRRIVFQGRRRREWAFDKVTGVSYSDPRGPLLRTGNRKRISGLSSPRTGGEMWLMLSVALADFFGDRADLVAWSRRGLVVHRASTPRPPPPAVESEAPANAAPVRPAHVLWSTIAVIALFAFFCSAITNNQGGGLVDDTARTASSTGDATDPALSQPSRSPSDTPSASEPPSPAEAPEPETEEAEPEPEAEESQPARTVDLCGAPSNPYGYNFCGGANVYDPPRDICDYFECIGAFWNGKGFMIECADGEYSMSGGRQGSCSHHGGNNRPVYQ